MIMYLSYNYVVMIERIMSKYKILCNFCNLEIIQYYHANYKGDRGRCRECGIDFPLD